MYKDDCIDSIETSTSRPSLDWQSWAAQGYSLVKRDAKALFGLLLHWDQRARDRKALREMEQHRLDDIGVSRRSALREGSKPFWWL